MTSKLPALLLVWVAVVSGLSPLFLKPVAAQDNRRGVRIEQPSPAEGRVALVIGNGAYKDSPLLNPVNDARDMAQLLRSLGFEVIYGENLSQNDMKRNIRAFGQKIRDGSTGLFYYAGHGIQVKGSNYLIPVNATIASEEEVEYESVDTGLVLAQMETAHNRLNIVILDACRNNPFARSFRSTQKGLASLDAPSGTLIAYATAPGSVASDGAGRNGLYTQELLKVIRIPGLSVEEVFKRVRVAVRKATGEQQTPWESSSLIGQFYFSGGPVDTARIPEAGPPVTRPPQQQDRVSDAQPVGHADNPNIVPIGVGQSQKGTIVEGQYKDYMFDGVANSPVLFTLRAEECSNRIMARYKAEIDDSRGKKLKEPLMIYNDRVKEIPFTPPTQGQYVIRLQGVFGRCKYTVYLDRP